MTAYLLDTQIVLFAAIDPTRLSSDVRNVLSDSGTDVAVSAVSIAEMAIKQAIGKLSLPISPVKICETLGVQLVPLTPDECEGVATIPLRHRDPFDRLLVAQCLTTGRALVTADRQLWQYDEIEIIRND